MPSIGKNALLSNTGPMSVALATLRYVQIANEISSWQPIRLTHSMQRVKYVFIWQAHSFYPPIFPLFSRLKVDTVRAQT
jgi:hypothetical protein